MNKANANPHWWRGLRGEWYVAVQFALLALIVLGPSQWPNAQAWAAPFGTVATGLGVLLMTSGVLLSVLASFNLGSSLTPLPQPKDDATLRVHGTYSIVRHPIYSGLILAAFGWALWVHGGLTLCYAVLLLIFFDIKSRREERWLLQKYPDYAAYQQRVRKLIPFVY